MNSTIIYRLQPTNPNAPLEPIGKISHGGHNIVSLAIKTDAGGKVWLALGSEQGDIWIAKNQDLNILESELDMANGNVFQKMEKVHDSSVSGLTFNPGFPQLASASQDGTVRLWNLTKSGNNHSDDITLRDPGFNIKAIVYINRDELLVQESIINWITKTNTTALKEELDCLVKSKQNCKNGIR